MTSLSSLCHHARLVACIGLAGVALAGCQSTLSTTVDVSANSAQITVNLNLTGDAASVIDHSPRLIAELNHVVSTRMGSTQSVSVSPSLVSWTGHLTYAKLIANADILGVGALSTSPAGSNLRVSVGMVDPTGLDAALASGAKGQPSSAALLITMERYTYLSLTLVFPGRVSLISASSSSVSPTVSGNTATLTQSLFSFHPGAFVVQGSTSSSSTWYWWVGAGVVVIGLVYLLGRRRY